MKLKIAKSTMLTLLTIFVFFFAFAFISSSSKFVNTSAQTTEPVNTNTQEYVVNKQTGEKSTIIWTQGIDAPLMAADEDLETATGRYFRKKEFHEVDGDYSMYYYPMESNKNYFDFNKNPARTNIHPQQVAHHCYLASAMNLIYWWMSQNSSYIDRYVELIQQGYFSQPSDLHAINDIEMWNKYRATPQVEYIQDRDYYSMDLSNNPMYREVFKSFQTRDEGYWPDLVWDSFFNGYTPEGKDPLYMPSRDGGFFYPLFGNKAISKAINMGSYDFFSKTVLENLRAGNGIGLAYQSVGPAHAITIWGAEYNSKDQITRIYFTDSDDFDASEKTSEGILKGLYSNEIVEDKNGNPRLTTRNDRTKGSLINSIFILSLAQDRLDSALNDLADPIVPKIIEDLPNLGYKSASEKPRSLDVKVKKEDNGKLTYQWYEANDLTSVGKKIDGATKSFYSPIPIEGQDKYYYCVVTNTKHSKTAKAVTNRSKVFVDENVINAQVPEVYYTLNNGSRKFTYNQYEQPKALRVNVNKKDDGIITYQWYQRESISNPSPVGGTPIEGAIYPVFYPKTDVSGVVFDYYCVVTNTNPKANGITTVTASPASVLVFTTLNPSTLVDALTPRILEHPKPLVKYDGSGEIPTLKVYSTVSDNGNLSYQWYEANDEYSTGKKIEGANQSTYKPLTNKNGTKYYYCEITNTNLKATNNTQTTVISDRSQVVVDCKEFKTMARFGNDLSLIFLYRQSEIQGNNYYAKINHKTSLSNQQEVIIPQTEWKTFENAGVKYFAIEYSGIAGKQMSDIISIQIYNSANQGISSVYETSIRDYGMKCLYLYQDMKIKTLIVDMLNYGASAQLYFEYNTQDLANKLLTEEHKTFASTLNTCTDYRQKDDNYYYGTAARFDNNINLVFFFNNLTDEMSVKFRFTPFNKNEEVVITVTSKDFKTYQGMYAVELNDLVVADAREIVTCELYDKDGNIIATIKDSVESYVARNDKGDNIFTNFMKFADSSRIYLNKNN